MSNHAQPAVSPRIARMLRELGEYPSSAADSGPAAEAAAHDPERSRRALPSRRVLTVAALGVALAVGALLLAGPAGADTGVEAGDAAYATQHYAAAVEHYRRAAEAGERSAQEILGLMVLYGPALYGDAVAQDRATARVWLGRAAAQGSEVARFVIARMDASAPSAATASAAR